MFIKCSQIHRIRKRERTPKIHCISYNARERSQYKTVTEKNTNESNK